MSDGEYDRTWRETAWSMLRQRRDSPEIEIFKVLGERRVNVLFTSLCTEQQQQLYHQQYTTNKHYKNHRMSVIRTNYL